MIPNRGRNWIYSSMESLPCSLLRLPREIRDHIYHCLFTATRLASGEWPSSIRLLMARPAPNSLAILLTCRQIFEEAKDLWIYRVLFDFTNVEAMLDKLSPLSPSTISKIRHVRVRFPTVLLEVRRTYGEDGVYHEDDVYYKLAWCLKLLPTLRLDILTFIKRSSPGRIYGIVEELIKHGDGWRELHILAGNSEMLGFPRCERFEPPDQRKPQPSTWNKMLLKRDGKNSGGSVIVYRATQSDRVGRVLDPSKRQIFEQKLSLGEDLLDYGIQEDPALMAPGERELELLVVVKRGPKVNILVQDEPPYSDDDMRQWSGTMSWEEIRYHCIDHIPRIMDGEARRTTPLAYDYYSNIDGFEWNVLS